MTKIILDVTEEELERLDSIGIFNPDMAGVLWQRVTITPIDKAESAEKSDSDNKGEWIDNGNGSYTCSNCKTEWTTSQIEKMCFCPTCGADMRDPKDIIHKAIDNTTFAEEAYPNIKEELHKAVDMAESEGTE